MRGIIDSHVHLYPPEVNRDPAGWAAAQGEEHWALLCTRRRSDGRPVQAFPTLDELLAAMDEAGVARAVLLGWYWRKAANCARQNRFHAECVRAHPVRLAAFAAVQPAAGASEVLAEVGRARDEGLVGLGELSPHAQGYAFGDPAFRAMLALAAEHGLPVNLHVTDPASRPYPGRIDTPLEDFVALARDFPAVTFILAHWGGLLPLQRPEAAVLPNLYYDTAASPLLCVTAIWRIFPAATGAARVLFGSDYPLNLYPQLDPGPNLGRLVEEARPDLPATAQAGVLWENALRLLPPGPRSLTACFRDCQPA